MWAAQLLHRGGIGNETLLRRTSSLCCFQTQSFIQSNGYRSTQQKH